MYDQKYKKVALWIVIVISYSSSAEVTHRTANNGNLIMEGIPEASQQIVGDLLNSYQNVRSASFEGFAQSGDEVYISTCFGSVYQLHKVSAPNGARQQMTFFKEPISRIARRPSSDQLTFSMDASGNESSQLFLLDVKTGKSRMLTDGQSRNGQLLWNNDGNQFVYSSTRRNGKSNDLWLMSPQNPEAAALILTAKSEVYWSPIDWSQDNKKLLIEEFFSAANSRIYELDVTTKTKTLVAGDFSAPSVNYGQGYVKNDQAMFYTTNKFSGFNQLAYKRFDRDEVTVITENIPWDVVDFSLSDDDRRAAFVINEEGFSKLYLLDTKTLKYKLIKDIPTGLIENLEFNGQGNKLGLTLSTAQSPSDIYVLSLKKSPLGHKKLVRWTQSEVGGLDSAQFVTPELIHFHSFDKRSIPAFIYKPNNRTQKHPVIINIHGGPEQQYRPSFRSLTQLWVSEFNAAVVAPNVRGSSGYGKEYLGLDNGFLREDSVKDIGALLDWIKAQPDLDEDRVIVLGRSYGGYMALASAVNYSDRLKGAIDIVGISNFVTFLENTKDYRRDLRRVEYGDERDPKMREYLESISPNNQVDKIQVPLFVVQGQSDPRVPVTEAEQIVNALRKEGKPVWYMNALNEGHGYRKKENRDLYMQAVMLFLKQYL